MDTLLEYKCPCCGGAINFDSTSQKLKCPYCDSEFDVETLKAYDEELKNVRDDDMQWQKEPEQTYADGDDLSVFVCKSCGGEIICDENTAATKCPYCDNPVVLTGRLAGDLKPDLVIPFKLDKNAAKEGMKKHLMGKKLLPRVFKEENHIDEIKGIYVPFWIFDADADAAMRYKATKLRTWSDRKYNYTETSHFSVTRGGSLSFRNIPADASAKIRDDLTESLEPFDFGEAVDFKTAYLAGYLADKYDVTAEQSMDRVNGRIKNATEKAFADTVLGYASVVPESGSVVLMNSEVKYALLPVWILGTTWQDKHYVFAMNGQTGKFVGDLPLDKKAYFKWLAILAGSFSAAFALISVLMWLL